MATLTYSSVTYNSVRLTSSGAGTPTKTRYWYFTVSPGNIETNTSNMSTSGSVNINGLQPGTTYTAQCRYGTSLTELEEWAEDGTAGKTYYGGTCTFTTPSYVNPEIYTCNPSSTLTSIKVPITLTYTRDYARKVVCVIADADGNNSKKSTETIAANANGRALTANFTFEGLSPSTKYKLNFAIYDPANGRTWSNYFDVSTKEAFSLSISTSASPQIGNSKRDVTIYATIDKTYDFPIPIWFYILEKGTTNWRQMEETIEAGQTSCKGKFEVDISPATTYYCRIEDRILGKKAPATTNPDGTAGYIKRRTKNEFSWTNWGMDVASGTPFYINPAAWNEYTSQLSAKANYYDISYDPATIKAGDILTAEKYNNIAATIRKMVNGKKGDCITPVYNVKTGDPVTAYCINILATCLNE